MNYKSNIYLLTVIGLIMVLCSCEDYLADSQEHPKLVNQSSHVVTVWITDSPFQNPKENGKVYELKPGETKEVRYDTLLFSLYYDYEPKNRVAAQLVDEGKKLIFVDKP